MTITPEKRHFLLFEMVRDFRCPLVKGTEQNVVSAVND